MRERLRRPHIEPEAVVRAALEILDSSGADNLTIRQIAATLGVKAPALYWHFRDKRDLMDDMAQTILKDAGIEDISFPNDLTKWNDWLIKTAHTLRNALLSHRDGARVVAGASFFRATSLARLANLMIHVLEKAGFGMQQAALAATTIINYIWGDVIEEQAGIGPEPGPVPTNWRDTLTPALKEIFEEMAPVMAEVEKLTTEERFDWGLQLIISGLKLDLRDKNTTKRE